MQTTWPISYIDVTASKFHFRTSSTLPDVVETSPMPKTKTSASVAKQFKCSDCSYLTDRKNNLKRHQSTMHRQMTRSLECCSIIFTDKSTLRNHVTREHGAGTGYACGQCGRRFGRRALMRRHAVVHETEQVKQQLQPTKDDDPTSEDDYSMSGKHLQPSAASETAPMTPHIARRFACPVCGYSTGHKSNLDRHMRRHGTPIDRSGTISPVSKRFPSKNQFCKAMSIIQLGAHEKADEFGVNRICSKISLKNSDYSSSGKKGIERQVVVPNPTQTRMRSTWLTSHMPSPGILFDPLSHHKRITGQNEDFSSLGSNDGFIFGASRPQIPHVLSSMWPEYAPFSEHRTANFDALKFQPSVDLPPLPAKPEDFAEVVRSIELLRYQQQLQQVLTGYPAAFDFACRRFSVTKQQAAAPSKFTENGSNRCNFLVEINEPSRKHSGVNEEQGSPEVLDDAMIDRKGHKYNEDTGGEREEDGEEKEIEVNDSEDDMGFDATADGPCQELDVGRAVDGDNEIGADDVSQWKPRCRLLPLLHTCRTCAVTFTSQLQLKVHGDACHQPEEVIARDVIQPITSQTNHVQQQFKAPLPMTKPTQKIVS